MKGAQVGERVHLRRQQGQYGTVERRDPWLYLLDILWYDGSRSRVHEMYVEPSRVPAPVPSERERDG